MEILISTCPEGIISINLPYIEDVEDECHAISECLLGIKIQISGDYPPGKVLAQEMRRYFKGECLRFNRYALIWDNITPFEKKVLVGLRYIPFGQIMCYSAFARIIGCPGGARAVGQALKRNPWPILVPCHRVIGARGDLKGFSSGKGWKKILLSIEKHFKEVSE